MTKQEIKESPVGLRFNKGKLRWGLVNYKALEPMIRVLMFGAEKYDDHNWKKGMPRKVVLECLQRHLADLMDGQTHDKESGLPLIGHIMCNAMFYQYYVDHNIGADEEPAIGPPRDDRESVTDMLDKFRDSVYS